MNSESGASLSLQTPPEGSAAPPAGGDRRPLRIGIFTDMYLPDVGGTERAVHGQRRMLESLGHEVFLVTASDPRRDPAEPGLVQVRSARIPTTPYRVTVPRRGTVRGLRGLGLDLVHVHTQFVVGALADMLARDQDLPVVQTTHTLISGVVAYHPYAARTLMPLITAGARSYFRRTGRRAEVQAAAPLPAGVPPMERLAWELMVTTANAATVVTTPSQHLNDTLRRFGVHRPNLVLPNAVDTGDFAVPREPLAVDLPPAALRVVSVGRVDPEKRVDQIIHAFARLPRSLDAQLVLVGTGSELAACRRLARRLDLADRVVFTGVLPPRQVGALLHAGDVFVVASAGFDNQPLVVLEAASAGLPIVYCDPALTEGLTPGNAVLADSPGPAGLADAIEGLLTDDRRRVAMGEESARVGAGFDTSVMRHRLDEVYRTALRLHAARV